MVPSATVPNRRRLLTAVLGAFAVLVLAACRPIQAPAAPQPAIPELAIEVGDSGFLVPDPAPGGIVIIAIRNTGAQPHTASLWRIRDGHTQDEIHALNDLLQENPDAFFGIFELGSWIHYSEEIAPGATQQFYADLGTGDFFVIDDANPDLAPAFFTAPEIVGPVEPAADA